MNKNIETDNGASLTEFDFYTAHKRRKSKNSAVNI